MAYGATIRDGGLQQLSQIVKLSQIQDISLI